MVTISKIKVCKITNCDTLYKACSEYVLQVNDGAKHPELAFTLLLNSGAKKNIIFRQKDNEIEFDYK